MSFDDLPDFEPKPEDKPIPDHSKHFLYEENQHKSNSSHPSIEEKKSLNDRLKKGIKIGLNDKIAFTKHLFGGSTDDYNRVLSQLNTMATYQEAESFIQNHIKPDYNSWEDKEAIEARFMEIIEHKFK